MLHRCWCGARKTLLWKCILWFSRQSEEGHHQTTSKMFFYCRQLLAVHVCLFPLFYSELWTATLQYIMQALLKQGCWCVRNPTHR